MVETHNELSGRVADGHVVQAHRIDQLVLSGQTPQALRGLPPDAVEFVGRADQLAELLNILDPGTSETAAVTAVSGLAGVGKTTLAVRAAHQAAHNGWYPGGVLFMNLQGYDTAAPVDARSALATFLQQLGVRREDVPPEPSARESLYRSQLAEHASAKGAVLIVLDNAASADQVRPLLPSDPLNRVLTTSRHMLAELAGARQLSVDLLPADDSVGLLRTALRLARPSDQRVDDDPDSAEELARHCGFLPLALSIVAKILNGDPERPVAELAEELRDASTRLGELAVGGRRAVRAALELSYARLEEDERRMFRLFALSPGGQLSTEAGAALAGTSVGRARTLLRSLHRANMIGVAGARGVYRPHDLVRLFANERFAEEDEHDRGEAVTRLIDYYLETASAAVNQLRPETLRYSALRRFSTRAEALVWLDAERAGLVGTVLLGQEFGRSRDARDLAFLLSGYFDLRKHWDDWAQAQEVALTAARSLGDRAGEARALNSLGNIARQLREFDTALARYEQALDLRQADGNRAGAAVTLTNLSGVHWLRGDTARAFEYCAQALEIHREFGDRFGQAVTVRGMASICRRAGRVSESLEHDREGLRLSQEIGDIRGEAQGYNNLGNSHRLLGDVDEAIEFYQRALARHQDAGDRHGEAQTRFNLGLAYLERQGGAANARRSWEEAHAGFLRCGDRHEAALVAARLAELGKGERPTGRSIDFFGHTSSS